MPPGGGDLDGACGGAAQVAAQQGGALRCRGHEHGLVRLHPVLDEGQRSSQELFVALVQQ
ncbi:hypothetical protein [Streptomyces sp. ODS28]|uniref:hypothetical protein n=1 Tax=Streptomyces sp. ODS28 TaxID=3136688 RepID=UPI0031EA88DD